MFKNEKDRANALYKKYLLPSKVRFYKKYRLDVQMGKREGIYFWDPLGKKRYINLHCNGGVFNLGHNHPRLVSVLKSQIGRLDIGNHHLISKAKGELAKAILSTIPQGKWNLLFGSSGGEAVDLSLKLAFGWTRRRKVFYLKGGYHGHTGLAVYCGEEQYKKPFHLQHPHFIEIGFEDLDRIESVLTTETAALILETIPATLGMPVIPEKTMKRIRNACDQKGVVLILDEIQTGLGRTGRFWGFEHYGIVPDIFVVGKGLSGGLYPISACIFQKRFLSLFDENPFVHISTFGGSDLGCMVAKEVIAISRQPSFLKHVQRVGQVFQKEIMSIARSHGIAIEIRGKGLFQGILFENEQMAKLMVLAMIRQGAFVVYANNDKRVMQFLPPLIIKDQQVEEVLQLFDKALYAVKSWPYKILKAMIK